MKTFTKAVVICLAVFFTAGLYGSAAFAATGFEGPPGAPPYGLDIQKHAEGKKLDGVLFVEFFNYDPGADSAGGARVFIRLTKGDNLQTFFKLITGPILGVIENTNDVLITIKAAIHDDILYAFFPNKDVPSLTITVKKIENYMDIYVPGAEGEGSDSIVFVTDIVLAVK
jgi:hypothetical protein